MDYFHFVTSLTPLKAGEPMHLPLRLLAGCGNFVEKFVSVYRAMVQISASLKDLSAVRDWIRVAVAHSAQNFDLVVKSFGDGGG